MMVPLVPLFKLLIKFQNYRNQTLSFASIHNFYFKFNKENRKCIKLGIFKEFSFNVKIRIKMYAVIGTY